MKIHNTTIISSISTNKNKKDQLKNEEHENYTNKQYANPKKKQQQHDHQL
jgi:hypothetical protein